jgi:hypothetical protein
VVTCRLVYDRLRCWRNLTSEAGKQDGDNTFRLKRLYPHTRLHGVISQKSISVAASTSNLVKTLLSFQFISRFLICVEVLCQLLRFNDRISYLLRGPVFTRSCAATNERVAAVPVRVTYRIAKLQEQAAISVYGVEGHAC